MSAEAVRAGREVRVSSRALRLLTDDRLTVLAGRGSSAAFEVLYMRHHQAVYRYCRSILRGEEEARDALQSTMLRAFAALRDGREVAFRPWLFAIAHNESVKLVQGRGSTDALPEADQLPSLVRSVEDEVAVRERFSVLSADLRELPERQRSALVMRELSGLSHAEIGVALGVSSGAAKQVIFEARAALFEFAAGRDESCEAIRRRLSDGDGRMLRGRAMRAHMRACAGCRAFRSTLAERPAKIAALAPPLAPAAALPLLAHVTRGAAATHSAAAPLAGAAGGKAIAGSLLAKAAVGAVLATTATVAVVHVVATPHERVSLSRVQVGSVARRAPSAGLVAHHGTTSPARGRLPSPPHAARLAGRHWASVVARGRASAPSRAPQGSTPASSVANADPQHDAAGPFGANDSVTASASQPLDGATGPPGHGDTPPGTPPDASAGDDPSADQSTPTTPESVDSSQAPSDGAGAGALPAAAPDAASSPSTDSSAVQTTP